MSMMPVLCLLLLIMRKYWKVIHSLKNYWGNKKFRNLFWELSRHINFWKLILVEFMLSSQILSILSNTSKNIWLAISIHTKTKFNEKNWWTIWGIKLLINLQINLWSCPHQLSAQLFWWTEKVLQRIYWWKMFIGFPNKCSLEDIK